MNYYLFIVSLIQHLVNAEIDINLPANKKFKRQLYGGICSPVCVDHHCANLTQILTLSFSLTLTVTPTLCNGRLPQCQV